MKTYEYVNFGLISGIANTLGGAGGELVRTGAGIGNFFKRVGQAGWNVASNAANAVKTGVGNAIDYVKNDINSAGQAMQQGYQDALTNPNVNRFPPIQKQPAVASDGTVVKNENTPNFEDIDTNPALGDVTQGGMANAQTQRDITQGVQQMEVDKAQAEANQKAIAQKAAADKAAKAKAVQEKAAADAAAAKQQASVAGQQVSGMKAILAAITAGRPLNPSQQNVLRQNNVKADPNAIQQWIQQHGG